MGVRRGVELEIATVLRSNEGIMASSVHDNNPRQSCECRSLLMH